MISIGATGNGTPTTSSVVPMGAGPSVVSRWSHAAAMMHPPAIAAPSIAATIGRGQVNTAMKVRCNAGISSATYAGPPAQNTRPLPVMTAARSEAATPSSTSPSAPSNSRSRAFTLP
jgi:hypothetical protein